MTSRPSSRSFATCCAMSLNTRTRSAPLLVRTLLPTFTTMRRARFATFRAGTALTTPSTAGSFRVDCLQHGTQQRVDAFARRARDALHLASATAKLFLDRVEPLAVGATRSTLFRATISLRASSDSSKAPSSVRIDS